MITVTGILLSILGLALLCVGWRGAVVASVRQCGQCGYDLRGTPDASRCSECGNDVSNASGLQTQLRRKRWKLMALAAVAVMLGIAMALPSVQQSTRSVFTITNVPQWWLRHSLLSANQATCDPAADELRRRVVDGTLGQADSDALLTALRARQLKPALPWSSALRSLADDALSRGLFSSNPTLSVFLADSVRFEALPAEPSSQYAKWPMVRVLEVRGFSSHLLEVDTGKMDIRFLEHPGLVREDCYSTSTTGNFAALESHRISFSGPAPLSYLALLGPGEHPVRLNLKYTVSIFRRAQFSGARPVDLPAAPRNFSFEGKVLVPQSPAMEPAPPTTKPTTRSSLEKIVGPARERFGEQTREPMLASDFFTKLQLAANDRDGGSHITLNQGGNRPSFDLRVPARYASFAGIVYLKDPQGRLWLVDDVRFAPGHATVYCVYASDSSNIAWKDFDSSHVTLIVESNPFVATYSGLAGPWLVGRRVFENVPVWREAGD